MTCYIDQSTLTWTSLAYAQYSWMYRTKCFLRSGMVPLWLCFYIKSWFRLQPALEMLTLKMARFQGSHFSVFLSSLIPDDLKRILPAVATAVYGRASCRMCRPRLAARVCISRELPQPHSAECSQWPAAAPQYIWNTYALIVPDLKKVTVDMGSKESYSHVQSTQLVCLIYYFLLWKWLKRLIPPLYLRGIWIPSLPRLSL